MKVQDLMTREVGSCRPFASADEGARVMWERDCGAVPIVDQEGRVVAMVTDRAHDAEVKSDVRNAMSVEEEFYIHGGGYVAFSAVDGATVTPPGFSASAGPSGASVPGRPPASRRPAIFMRPPAW